jgi:hypothetical protein
MLVQLLYISSQRARHTEQIIDLLPHSRLGKRLVALLPRCASTPEGLCTPMCVGLGTVQRMHMRMGGAADGNAWFMMLVCVA